MNANGTGQTQLTIDPGSDDQPAWAPDGTRIAFQSNRDGNNEIYVMNANGSSQTRLTNNTSPDGEPTWSPDGTRIAFQSARNSDLGIYVMNADGTGQTPLTNNPAIDTSPAWQLPTDIDSDGVIDLSDNCKLVANPTQLDANGDGYGNICDADLNNSGTVTTADFGLLRSVLNQAAGSSATAAAADLNGSGTVTTADFAILRARLNTAPGPSGLVCAGTIPCP